jgi:hypothetical protein
MGYVTFVLFFCPVGKSSGGTSVLLEGVCGMPIQLHVFRLSAVPGTGRPRSCTTAEFSRIQDRNKTLEF